MKKNILFVISVDSYFTILFEVAKYLQEKTDLVPVLYFPMVYPSVSKNINTCIQERIEYIKDFQGEYPKIIYSNNSLHESILRKKLIQFCKFLIHNPLFVFIKYLKYLIKETLKVRKILNKKTYSLLVLAGDNIGYNIPLLIKQCHKKNIPSAIIAGWMSGPLEAYSAYSNNMMHSMKKISNLIFGSLNPKYVYELEGHKIIRWPAGQILAMKLFKIIPPEPWLLHSGYADALLVDSKSMAEYVEKEGFKSIPYCVAGSIQHDLMCRTIKQKEKLKIELYQENNFCLDKKLIIVALTPNMLYGDGRPECEFQNYEKLVESIISTIVESQIYNVLISLHPSTQISDVKYIEQHNIRISDKKIIDIIPLCDIFVASASATIQWAIACEKPIINYDVYRYHYTDYINVKGVLYVETMKEYKDIFRKLTYDLDYFNAICDMQKLDSVSWGLLDGKSGERIVQIFMDLMSGVPWCPCEKVTHE